MSNLSIKENQNYKETCTYNQKVELHGLHNEEREFNKHRTYWKQEKQRKATSKLPNEFL